jgi:hypothetical protein
MDERKVIPCEVNTLQMVELRARITECVFGSFIYSFSTGIAFSFFSRKRRVGVWIIDEEIQEFTGFKSIKRKCRLMALVAKPVNTSSFEF